MCLRRTWLLGELGGHLDPVRADIGAVLALGDAELVQAVGGRRGPELRQRLDELDPSRLRAQARAVGLELVCRCDPAYPTRVRELESPPAVLHVAGGMARFLAAAGSDPVALVGCRSASAYGTDVARSLARSLVCAGVPVISGMAMGIDAAAHHGALQAGDRAQAPGGPTIAVLPGSAHRAYPRGAHGLYRELLRTGSAVSELPPGVGIRSWMFLARNRIIAALAAMTVVVEAGSRSGALVTATCASALGRELGAVPGRITAPQAAGTNRLLKDGARVVCGAQEILDLLFEAGSRTAAADDRPALDEELRSLLAAIEQGHDTAAALLRQGILPEQGLAALASLELAGYVRRGAGGRLTVVP